MGEQEKDKLLQEYKKFSHGAKNLLANAKSSNQGKAIINEDLEFQNTLYEIQGIIKINALA